MRKISPKVRDQLEADPRMKVCSRREVGDCSGRITWEHCWIYAGRQIDEAWSIISLCEHHHLYSGLDKEENQRISLRRATDEELAKYPKKDWEQLKKYLL